MSSLRVDSFFPRRVAADSGYYRAGISRELNKAGDVKHDMTINVLTFTGDIKPPRFTLNQYTYAEFTLNNKYSAQ